MPDHHTHRPPPDPNDRYEKSDLSIPGITKGVVIYFIFTMLIGVVVLVGMAAFNENKPEPVIDQIPSQPYPLLQNQTTASTDIWNLRSREDYLLHNYTYADPNHQYVRVPVDTMIDKMAAEGLGSVVQLPKGYEATKQPPANTALSAENQSNPSNPPPSLEDRSTNPADTYVSPTVTVPQSAPSPPANQPSGGAPNASPATIPATTGPSENSATPLPGHTMRASTGQLVGQAGQQNLSQVLTSKKAGEGIRP